MPTVPGSSQAQDFFRGDTGNIRAFSVIITPAVCDAVAMGANVTATKAITGGNQQAGGNVIYTVTLTNSGNAAQADNPGNEFTDTVPSPLVVGTPTANSGTVSGPGVNPVTWNGAIPAGGTVTITIPATIPASAAGQTISNQGTVNYDSDNDGVNDATSLTDAPGGTVGDPTVFVAGAPPDGSHAVRLRPRPAGTAGVRGRDAHPPQAASEHRRLRRSGAVPSCPAARRRGAFCFFGGVRDRDLTSCPSPQASTACARSLTLDPSPRGR